MTSEKYKVAVPEGVSGDWKVDHFTIDEHSIGALYDALHGRPISHGTYTRLTYHGSVIMSDTDSEVRDHLEFIWQAKGRCLINGLGLGVVLKAVAAKPEVTHIDVVEKSQDVINLVWPTYQDHDRIILHHDDAYTIEWPKGTTWDCAWHDIWPNICTDNLPEITRLKRKYAGKVAWQRAWVEDTLRYYRRQGR